MELCIGIGDKSVESLFVRTRGQTCEDYFVVGICYRPLDQDEKVDETFFGQLKEALRFLILVTHERP